MSLIYIVEDDQNIREIENYALTGNGYAVRSFSDARGLDEALTEKIPDLLLLDIMLPGEDGLSILQRLRSHSATKKLPIILITAKATEIDMVKGLDQGADDYIIKPFGVLVLLARVKAMLRRSQPDSGDMTLGYREISLDQERRTCLVGEEKVDLTYTEFELLKMMMGNVGIVLTREGIMNHVWGEDFSGESRTVDMHIKSLRKKLGDAGGAIVTVRNVGYKLE